jgi:lipopolysaccharide transport system ATP-binding protein
MSVISVDGISKQYTLGVAQKQRSLRETLTEGVRGLLQKREAIPESVFWALKDVSFEVAEGDRVGIIGRNGAGKSTLLKVLSRITEPSVGQIRMNGRVASLLEVGTGFHPELTGRENIYLNGAILGMSKVEIKQKFDEIVAFSEVEKFLDTPVKRYSSGMYVRLAFAVAANLESEILIVDEVLAVGDTEFQKKCLGKMENISNSGRTILFVSHSLAFVNSLCNKGIWLVKGQLNMEGSAEEVTKAYLSAGTDLQGEVILQDSPDKQFWFKRLSFHNEEGDLTSSLDIRRSSILRVESNLKEPIRNLEISIRISNSLGIAICTLHRSASTMSELRAGRTISEITIPSNFLVPGSYTIDIAGHIPNVEMFSYLQSVLAFDVEETGSALGIYQTSSSNGVVLASFPWKELEVTKAY